MSSQQTTGGALDVPLRMSLSEWADLPEDKPGELVDGLLEEEEEASSVHEVVAGSLLRSVGNWAVPQGGLVLGSATKYAVKPPGRGRRPDVSAFFAGSRMPPRAALLEIPPDLAIEVVSPSPRDGRRDRVEKLKEYAAFGIRWYWLVAPALRSIEILELGSDKRYVHALGASEGVIEEVPGCKGLRLDLDVLWGEVDRLGPAEELEPPPERQ
jgi:Uma2 family endonuclease